jgi:hypothetical protein
MHISLNIINPVVLNLLTQINFEIIFPCILT